MSLSKGYNGYLYLIITTLWSMYIAKPTTSDPQELKDVVPGKDVMPIVQATGMDLKPPSKRKQFGE